MAQKITEYNGLMRRFNARLLDFIRDLKDSFEPIFPSFKDLLLMSSKLGAESPLAAERAWTFFNKKENRECIEAKVPQDKLFDCDDMLGFSFFDIRPREFWKTAKSADDGETTMTIHKELGNLLKLLDKLHACKPFPTASTRQTGDEKKKPLFVTPVDAKETPTQRQTQTQTQIEKKEKPKENENEKEKEKEKTQSTAEQKRASERVHQTLERLISLSGNDPQLRDDFNSMLRDGDLNGNEPTEKQQDLFERMLNGLLATILPTSDDEREGITGRENDPRFKAAAAAANQAESDERRRKIREIFKQIAVPRDPNSAQTKEQTTQAQVRAQRRKDEAKDMSRYRIEAHFNFRLLEFLDHMVAFRGKSTWTNKSGKAIRHFPALEQHYLLLKQCFTKDNATTDIIRPFGEWAVKHHDRLKAHDNTLFSDAEKFDHPLLKTFRCDVLWNTFNADTKNDVWNRTYRIVTLATVYHDMNNQGFGELMDIINEVLEDAKIGYDVDGKKFSGHKQLVDSIIDRCFETTGMERFQNIFGKMQSSGENGLDGILKLVDHLTPSVGGGSTNKKQRKTAKGKKAEKSRFETEDL